MRDEPIRPGYKRTEVGVIPEDWEVKRLGEVMRIKHGRSQRGIADPDGAYPILATGGEIGRTNTPLFSSPSVLIGRKGTIDVPQYMDLPFWTVDTLFYSEISDNADAKFLFYKFLLIDWYSYNEASGVPSLNAKTIESIEVSLPRTKEEQRAIAEVLSDMDALLDALERLIAKKRAIKQGAMQALLTGRVRLPGFERKPGYKRTEVGVIPEDWEVKTFDELFDFLSTSSCSRSDLSESGNIHYIHYGDIHTRWDYNLDFDAESVPLVAFEKVKNIARLQDGDLIMVDASEDEEGVGKSVEILNLGGRSAVAGLHTLALRSKGGDLVNGFKAYLQANQAVRTQIRRVATGLKVFGISKNNLRDIFVPLPGPLEQTAIAEVLSDMDAEIETLERRRAKVRAIKQGMMQELLTGRVRLVGPNAEQ